MSLCFLFLASRPLYCHNPELKFEHITIADGLPSEAVTSIYQDSIGFLWFGTNLGLVRYDGYQLKTFYLIDSLAIIPNLPITSIQEDSRNNLWNATEESGLFRFDRNSNRIVNFTTDSTDSVRLSSNRIFSIYIDGRNRVWLSPQYNGLDLLQGGDRNAPFFARYCRLEQPVQQ
ncbi:hypothetical protein JW935_05665 [candidate division KSB1 bacterium]|nr:hypothetical protein [candidate division KSB1 bacterium]